MGFNKLLDTWTTLLHESEGVDEAIGTEYTTFADILDAQNTSKFGGVLVRLMDNDAEEQECEETVLDDDYTFILPVFGSDEQGILTKEGEELYSQLRQYDKECVIDDEYEFTFVRDEDVKSSAADDFSYLDDENGRTLRFKYPCECVMVDPNKMDRDLYLSLLDFCENPSKYVSDYENYKAKFIEDDSQRFADAIETAKATASEEGPAERSFYDDIDEFNESTAKDEKNSPIPLNEAAKIMTAGAVRAFANKLLEMTKGAEYDDEPFTVDFEKVYDNLAKEWDNVDESYGRYGRGGYGGGYGGRQHADSLNSFKQPLKLLDPKAPDGYFIATASGGRLASNRAESCGIYKDKKVKPMAMMIWKPVFDPRSGRYLSGSGKSIAVAEYMFAIRNNDQAAMKQIEEFGLPLDLQLRTGDNGKVETDRDGDFVDGPPAPLQEAKQTGALFEDGNESEHGLPLRDMLLLVRTIEDKCKEAKGLIQNIYKDDINGKYNPLKTAGLKDICTSFKNISNKLCEFANSKGTAVKEETEKKEEVFEEVTEDKPTEDKPAEDKPETGDKSSATGNVREFFKESEGVKLIPMDEYLKKLEQ